MDTSPRSSFRTRLAVQTMLVAAVVLVSYGAASWWYARQQLARTIDLRITESARRLWSRLTPRSPADEFAAAAADVFGERDPSRPSAAVVVLQNAAPHAVLFNSGDRAGFATADFASRLPIDNIKPLVTPGATSGELPSRSVRPQMPEIRDPVFFTAASAGDEWRIGAFSNPNYTIFVGFSLRGFYAEARRAGWWFISAGVLGLGVAGLGAWWSSRRAMRPLDRIVRTAQELTVADLGQRVPASSTDDREFAQLIGVLNGMMERLQLSFEQAARFTADASHELKTPLAVLHATTHDLLRRSAPGSAEHEQLESLACELSRLKSITQSLLLLSQADAGKLPLQRETYDLSTDLARLVEDAEALCAQGGLGCEHAITPSLRINADRALLRQVFQNLLSNAVKYNRPDGLVKITLEQNANRADLIITNSGPGISAEHQARLFDRFHRGDAARDRRTDGFGLGLNIARELARANGAELQLVESGSDSTSFLVRIPLVAT